MEVTALHSYPRATSSLIVLSVSHRFLQTCGTEPYACTRKGSRAGQGNSPACAHLHAHPYSHPATFPYPPPQNRPAWLRPWAGVKGHAEAGRKGASVSIPKSEIACYHYLCSDRLISIIIPSEGKKKPGGRGQGQWQTETAGGRDKDSNRRGTSSVLKQVPGGVSRAMGLRQSPGGALPSYLPVAGQADHGLPAPPVTRKARQSHLQGPASSDTDALRWQGQDMLDKVILSQDAKILVSRMSRFN